VHPRAANFFSVGCSVRVPQRFPLCEEMSSSFRGFLVSACLLCAASEHDGDVLLEWRLSSDAAAGSAASWRPLLSLPRSVFAAGAAAYAPAGDAGAALAAAAGAAPSGALVTLRVAGVGAASVPACALAEAGGRLDAALSPRALAVRPALPPSWRGCAAAAAAAAAGVSVRALATAVEAAEPLPAVVLAQGLAFPGQAEVGEVDAAMAAPDLPAEERAKLQAARAAEERRKAEEAKPWWQRYWHIILPAAIFLIMQTMAGGEKVEEAAQRGAAATAAAGAGAAPAR
jgi:hypothetical protein